ncbi:hypothetical protein EWM64_g6682 [Hericium alpestre]|uniref:Uncharacterized protein n=1 Tax=Hericium alpestre TaxID=135208 RepID=A0A4Y9ZTE3_9AGAM|nr:hypothetical protein EWM64_g6682 [Hericium alpestre]
MDAGLDWPYITTLLPNQTIEVHNVDTQQLAQVVAAPPLPVDETTDPAVLLAAERRRLAVSAGGFLVPSRAQSEKLRLKKVRLLGRTAKPDARETVELPSFEAFGAEGEDGEGAKDGGIVGAEDGTVGAEDGGIDGTEEGAVQVEIDESEDDRASQEVQIPPPVEGYDTTSP